MKTEQIKKLCAYLNQHTAERYPIANESLAESTDFIRNGYLKMLAVVLQQAGTVTPAQQALFQRILAGAQTEKTVEDYLRAALSVTIDDYLQFTAECRELPLKYRWLLDALLLTCTETRTEEQLRLIAQFCESLGLAKNEIDSIASMAKAILTLKEAEFVSAYEKKAATVPAETFSGYLSLLVKNGLCHNEHLTLFVPIGQENITAQMLKKIDELNTPCVEICGAAIDIGACSLEFSGREKVVLDHCHFTGSDTQPICFDNCQEVKIRQCTFTSFRTQTLEFVNSLKVQIVGCEFKDCINKCSSYGKLGNQHHMISGWEIQSNIYQFDIIDSSFEDCGLNNLHDGRGETFISNIKSTVNNCSFVNCWFYRDTWLDHCCDGTKDSIPMFTSDSSATNCTFEDSARFK